MASIDGSAGCGAAEAIGLGSAGSMATGVRRRFDRHVDDSVIGRSGGERSGRWCRLDGRLGDGLGCQRGRFVRCRLRNLRPDLVELDPGGRQLRVDVQGLGKRFRRLAVLPCGAEHETQVVICVRAGNGLLKGFQPFVVPSLFAQDHSEVDVGSLEIGFELDGVADFRFRVHPAFLQGVFESEVVPQGRRLRPELDGVMQVPLGVFVFADPAQQDPQARVGLGVIRGRGDGLVVLDDGLGVKSLALEERGGGDVGFRVDVRLCRVLGGVQDGRVSLIPLRKPL